MPTYQYACPDCGNEFEKQQKFTDKPIKKCPTCNKRSVYRVVGRVAVAFKGTGFYINDSKNGASKGKDKIEKPSEETKSADTTESTEPVKSEETTETKTEKKEDKKTDKAKKEKKSKDVKD
jgi:putative FmdB family regulatory protein